MRLLDNWSPQTRIIHILHEQLFSVAASPTKAIPAKTCLRWLWSCFGDSKHLFVVYLRQRKHLVSVAWGYRLILISGVVLVGFSCLIQKKQGFFNEVWYGTVAEAKWLRHIKPQCVGSNLVCDPYYTSSSSLILLFPVWISIITTKKGKKIPKKQ